jgi:hypothetical protein
MTTSDIFNRQAIELVYHTGFKAVDRDGCPTDSSIRSRMHIDISDLSHNKVLEYIQQFLEGCGYVLPEGSYIALRTDEKTIWPNLSADVVKFPSKTD